MYTEFYNLKEKPFNLSPSSKYLYLGDIHKEALALLTYGVIERMGFILLTGEVGTGKTTMVHALLNNLGEDVQYVYLSNPLFSVDDFMDYLAFSAFKKKVHFKSKADFLIQFESFLKELLQHQKNFILIIDEAQKLSIELLEEIRLLSNLETADEKLINIFLVGQPELNETLSRMECRPLLQRISVRYDIKALDQEGTSNYILSRLKKAGVENCSRIFPRKTIKEIFKYSQGYPRMINVLADNALLLGYSRGKKELTPGMIKECYNDLQLSNSIFARQEDSEKGPAPREKLLAHKTTKKQWKFVLMPILLILAVLFGAYSKDIYSLLINTLYNNKKVIQSDSSSLIPKQKIDHGEVPGSRGKTHIYSGKILNDNIKRQFSEESKKNPQLKDDTVKNEYKADEVTGEGIGINIPEDIQSSSNDSSFVQELMERTLTVKEGQTLAELAMTVYGYANNDVLNFIKEKNPEIENINIIEAGQVIKFPLPDDLTQGQVYTVHIASFTLFEKARGVLNDFVSKGYEAYIMPVYSQKKEKMFRVTLGSFKDKQRANEYVIELLEKGISTYTDVIKLEITSKK